MLVASSGRVADDAILSGKDVKTKKALPSGYRASLARAELSPNKPKHHGI